MGNAQGGNNPYAKRDRLESGTTTQRTSQHRHSRQYTDEECPVQVKIAKSSPNGSTPSMQYENTQDFPVVMKWGGNGKNVSLSGSWDGWKRRIPLVKSHDDFTTILNLPEGRHEYKYIVDGQWVCDNNLPKTDTTAGTQNNIMLIDRADFEVFDALDRDMAATEGTGSTRGSNERGYASASAAADDKQKAFAQEIPDRHDFEKAHHPPVLPPHLLQVILNKDTPVSCDPNVLPEPNHVMLNHLYALSIKDGVMVLSATHRYRKKYVTTLLYRPI